MAVQRDFQWLLPQFLTSNLSPRHQLQDFSAAEGGNEKMKERRKGGSGKKGERKKI